MKKLIMSQIKYFNLNLFLLILYLIFERNNPFSSLAVPTEIFPKEEVPYLHNWRLHVQNLLAEEEHKTVMPKEPFFAGFFEDSNEFKDKR